MSGDQSHAFKPGGHDHAVCIDDALAIAETMCQDQGLRLTALRRRVLELVWQQHNPVRAYDLLDKLRGHRRSAAPPTVYRALEFLIRTGLIHRIESLNAYVGCPDPHGSHTAQFLICRDCNAVGELDDPEISDLVTRRARDLGFAADRQTIEVMGLCPGCNPREGADGGL
jgi:Fur family zinc uptake transcriptional regulator